MAQKREELVVMQFFKFSFARAVKGAQGLDALVGLAPKADEECVSGGLTDEAIARIELLMGTAKPHIGEDVNNLRAIALNLTTYAGRLKAVELFMADGVAGVQAAANLIELVKQGKSSFCSECNPEGSAVISKIVGEVIVKFRPTAETSAADLALTGKVLQSVDMDENREARVVDGEIAEFAKRFTVIAELLPIAQSLSLYLNINAVLAHLLANNEAIDFETALAILKATKSRAEGGPAVINKLLRKLAASTGEDFDLCALLGKSEVFESRSSVMAMVLPSNLGSLLSPGGFPAGLFESLFRRQ